MTQPQPARKPSVDEYITNLKTGGWTNSDALRKAISEGYGNEIITTIRNDHAHIVTRNILIGLCMLFAAILIGLTFTRPGTPAYDLTYQATQTLNLAPCLALQDPGERTHCIESVSAAAQRILSHSQSDLHARTLASTVLAATTEPNRCETLEATLRTTCTDQSSYWRAIISGDTSSCSSLSDTPARTACVIETLQRHDPAQAAQLAASYEEALTTALQGRNPSLCNQLGQKDLVTQCTIAASFQLATTTQDPIHCQSISDDTIRAQCTMLT
ncbi:hypothetical protein HY641_04900 [Candidatus Woesearchaeota archaeon]|nr:hypothetical protein [Candidatus Woesearchaeota archaeon]